MPKVPAKALPVKARNSLYWLKASARPDMEKLLYLDHLFLRIRRPFPRLVERHKPLLFDTHGDRRHASNNRHFTWIAEGPRLHAGIRMWNKREHAILQLAPPTGVPRANVQEIDWPCKV